MKIAAVAVVGAIALAACWAGGLDKPAGTSAHPSEPLERQVYVWQAAALESAEALPDFKLWWFAGQVEMGPTEPNLAVFRTPELAEGVEIAGLVVRLRTPVVDWLQIAAEGRVRENLVRPLTEMATASAGPSPRLQLDFDCPTGKLHHYARLLSLLRAALPMAELSITALPDWLGSPDFAGLAKQVDFYVLQVHGLTLPATLDDSAPIFDPTRATRYVAEAEALAAPFHVALPTYGHRQWFRPDGGFVGISAERPPDLSPSAHIVREERAEPAEVAAFVRAVKNERREALRGLFWFRMPAAGDELNWCVDTFRHVVAGEAPPETLRAELRQVESGLLLVHLHNTPEHDYRGRAEVRLALSPGIRVIGEGLGGFVLERIGDEIVLTGRGPEPGDTMEVGWIRNLDGESAGLVSIDPRTRNLQ